MVLPFEGGTAAFVSERSAGEENGEEGDTEDRAGADKDAKAGVPMFMTPWTGYSPSPRRRAIKRAILTTKPGGCAASPIPTGSRLPTATT